MVCSRHPLPPESVTGRRLYNIWYGVFCRCSKDGRPIHPRWASYQRFFADIGSPPGNGSVICLRRREAGLVPGNVFWGDWRQKSQSGRNAKLINFKGKSQSISAWADEIGVLRETIRARLQRGLPIKEVLSSKRLPVTVPATSNVHCSSRHRGVSLHATGRWEAKIRWEGQLVYLGLFGEEAAAASAVRVFKHQKACDAAALAVRRSSQRGTSQAQLLSRLRKLMELCSSDH